MKRAKYEVAGGVLCAIVLIAGTTIAGMRLGHRGPGDGGERPPCEDPISDDMQAGLLERHGSDGIDADGDGVLTCEEVEAFFAANPPPGPRHGGHRPPCEDPIPDDMQAGLLERHGSDGIDADGNGVLTCEEVEAFFAANPPPGPRHGGQRPPCEDPIPDDMQAGLLERHGSDGIDADGNGVLTCEEVEAFFAENPPPGPRHGGERPQCEDPIPDDMQAGLLERHGSDGIDGDGDGVLKCEEVEAFFAENPPPGPRHGGQHPPCEDPISG